MALFTDGPACTIDDLIDEDSGLLDTAQTVGINVTAKLKLAMSEVQSELNTLPAAGDDPDGSAAHNGAGSGDDRSGAMGKNAGACDGLSRCVVYAAH